MDRYDKRMNQLLSFGFVKGTYMIQNNKYAVPYHEIYGIIDEEWDKFMNTIAIESVEKLDTAQTRPNNDNICVTNKQITK